jgi:hypothetical protein
MGSVILAIKKHQEIEALTEMFEMLVRKKHEIETGRDPDVVKERLLQRYEDNLAILNGAINAKGGLHKEVDGEEPKGTFSPRNIR